MLMAMTLLAPARGAEIVAVVVEVKGQATVKTEGDVSSRVGTQLKLLSSVEEGRTIKVADGGKVTLSFTRGGIRSTLTGPVEVVVKKDSVVKAASGGTGSVVTPKAEARDAKLAPRASMDLSRMGGVNARAICNVWTDQPRPHLALDLIRSNKSSFTLPAGAVKVYYRDLGSSEGAVHGEWIEATAQAKDDFLVPDWDLLADHSYSINLLTQPTDSNQPIDYSVRVFKPSALTDLNTAMGLADKPGPDFDVRQVTLIRMLDDYHLYDKALERAMALVERHPGEASLRELVQFLHEEKLAGEGTLR